MSVPSSNALKIVLIGSGNVATQLGKTISALRGYPIIQVFGKNLSHAKALGYKLQCPYTNHLTEINRYADLYLMAVKDDAIGLVVKQLSEYLPSKSLVVHTSGSVGMKELEPWFLNHGVLYPIQTFSKSKKSASQAFPVLITSSNRKSKSLMTDLANKISSTVLYIQDENRARVHLAAVLVNNFTNHLYEMAFLLLKEKKIDFEILFPLIEETTHKLRTMKPQEAQTGPARRNDQKVIAGHRLFLKANHPSWLKLYNFMTDSIISTYSK